MKRILLLCVTTILLTLCACGGGAAPEENPTPSAAPEDVYVYLIGGQSNAAGNGYIMDLSEEERAITYEHVFFYAGGDCLNPVCKDQLMRVSAENGQGHYAYSFGLEIGMAKVFTEEYGKDGVKRAIIKYAYDGSSIKSLSDGRDWNVYDDAGTGAHYTQFIEVVQAGLQALRAEGYNPVIKGMAWMQGETDYLVKDYEARLKALRDKVRVDLQAPQMYFVMGEIAYQNYGKQNYVNKAIWAISEEEPALCSFVACGKIAPRLKASECPAQQTATGGPFDNLHWSGENLVEIGRMFGNAFVTLGK